MLLNKFCILFSYVFVNQGMIKPRMGKSNVGVISFSKLKLTVVERRVKDVSMVGVEERMNLSFI